VSSHEGGSAADEDTLEACLRAAREAAEPADAAAGLAAMKHQLFGAHDGPEPCASGAFRLGRFELRRVLGRGAMGVVYEAWDPELARTVALKRLSTTRPQQAGDVPAVERLRREARAMARVDDPHVLRVYDVDEALGQPFVAMEYAPFGTLASWLESPRSMREVVGALLSAGRGLSAAHRAGLVHRDVKPSNMLCASDGCIKIGDFGLVGATTAVAVEQPATTEVRTRGTLGTPAYMAPEIWSGREAGPAADQYSFCVVLYEALYRARPFAGRSGREATPPSRTSDGRSVPVALRRILARGLAYEPQARFASMDALLSALERVHGRLGQTRVRTAAVAAALALIAFGFAFGAPGALSERWLRERAATEAAGAILEFGGWGERLAAAQLDFAKAASARAELIAVMQYARAQEQRVAFPDLALLFQHDAALRQRWFRARHTFDEAVGSRLIGRIPTHALALGEQTHPFIQFNLAAVQLAQAGLALSPEQRVRAQTFGERYERSLRTRAASYGVDTTTQRRFLDEAELKYQSDLAFRAVLSAQQRAVLVMEGGEHVLTWDEYGPASMLTEALVPVILRAGARQELAEALRGSASELLAPIDAASPEFRPVFDQMAAAIAPRILGTRSRKLAIGVDDALAFGRIMERARQQLLTSLPREHAARAALASGNTYAVFYVRSDTAPDQPAQASPAAELAPRATNRATE
jgi:hypothetical protein